MFLVRFSGFMAIPSMLRASQSTKLSISPSMLPSSSNSQLKKITAKRSVSRNSSEHYQLFQCIPWLWKIKQLVCPDLVRTTETRAHESRNAHARSSQSLASSSRVCTLATRCGTGGPRGYHPFKFILRRCVGRLNDPFKVKVYSWITTVDINILIIKERRTVWNHKVTK